MAMQKNLHSYNINEIKTNHQAIPSTSSLTTHHSPSLISQSDPWPHESVTQSCENTSSQLFIHPNRSDSRNLNFSSSDMNNKDWRNLNKTSGPLLSTDSILKQAIPVSLAAPVGWHSELIRSSSSTSNEINNNTNFIEKHEEYKTLNTSDGPPMIFSSTNESNRIINEIPSSPNIMNSSFSEYNNTTIDDSAYHEQKTIITEEQQTLIENQQLPPLVVHKKLPNNVVTYQQNVSVRYLQPPTPPPPGPIIIREIRPPPPPPQSPVQIRQRPPPPRTPPPLVIREKPPPVPPRPPSRVVEKLLPPPPRPPRRMIVDCFGPCPPKPADVIIERWLPYRRSDRRRIFYERIPEPYRPPQEPNLLIMHEQRHARVQKEFINEGVIRVDPQSYLQRYGSELTSSHSQYAHLVDEAARVVPAPQTLPSTSNQHQYHPPPYSNGYPPPQPSPLISNVWNAMKSASPIPHAAPYPHDYPQYNSPYSYPAQYPYNNHLNSYHSYNDYPTHIGDTRAMTNVTSSWAHNDHLSSPQCYYPSSSFTPQTIQVNSDGEFHHVLSDLTNGRVPTPFRSY